jgi:hypothetical protein
MLVSWQLEQFSFAAQLIASAGSTVASSTSDRRPKFHAAFRRSLFAALCEALVLSIARPNFVTSAQAASCRSVDRAWRFPRGAQRSTRQLRSQSSQQHSPGARNFRRAAGSVRFGSSLQLVWRSFLWANGGLTIHSSRIRFAARLNSGVRPLGGASCAALSDTVVSLHAY